MAVVNTTGSNTTLLDAPQPTRVDTAAMRGRKRIVIDVATVATTDSAGSTYRLGRVFSSDLITSLKLFNTAQTGFTSATVGLYQTAANGGTVVLAAAYATGISFAAASTTGVELAFASRSIASALQKVWQDGALAADPLRQLDIVVTATTIGTAGGTLMLQSEVESD